MQHYQTHPSELLAVRVVEHIEALYQHYDCLIPTDQLCAWKKVLQHWRRPAWISH